MTKTLRYSTENIQLIFDNLKNIQTQGKARDFEIRIDDFITVQRTSDLSLFHCYQNALKDESNEVSFILYKGNSRKYDKYVLIRKETKIFSPNESTTEYIESRVKQAVEEHKQKLEFERLKEENKSQKERIRELKQKVSGLEEKQKGDIKSLIELAKGFISKPNASGKKGEETPVNGAENLEMAKMITHFKNRFGREVFEKALGVGLQLAEHPKIIEEVKAFINQKLNNENN